LEDNSLFTGMCQIKCQIDNRTGKLLSFTVKKGKSVLELSISCLFINAGEPCEFGKFGECEKNRLRKFGQSNFLNSVIFLKAGNDGESQPKNCVER
jgi:hypothetical protein